MLEENQTSFIELSHLTASVRLNNGQMLTTVNDVSLKLNRGHSYAIVGKSGSGKTSLISIIGLLNQSWEGSYCYEGKSISELSDTTLSAMRAKKIGFVFQNYSLIKHLRVWENVELPMLYGKTAGNKKQRYARILELLKSVGLEGKEKDFPSNLSGGEQQRVAIARALAAAPEALLCDEPTGALDKKTGQEVMELLHRIVREQDILLLMVTHDPDLAATCDTIYRMDGGRLSCV